MSECVITSTVDAQASRSPIESPGDVLVTLRLDPGEVVVDCRGELDHTTRPLLAATLAKAREAGVANIVVDFTAVSFFDAATLDVLAVAHADWRGEGGSVKVRSLSPFGRHVFSLLRLDALLEDPDPVLGESDGRDRDPPSRW